MKKSRMLFLLILILCLIPLAAASAQTGIVTADALNVRASASTDSNVVGVVHEGEKVTIKDSTGGWYRISCNGKTGYVYKKYINVSSGSSSGSNSSGKSSAGSGSSGGTLAKGDTGDAVRKVQKRLIALGYLSGNADGCFGNMTMDAVKAYFESKEKPAKVMDFDGYRLEFPEWWFNIRPSNTEPYLRFICEATTDEVLEKKIAEAAAIIEGQFGGKRA